MWICSIIGRGLGPLSGMSCGGSCVNTDWNCWLRMLVFFYCISIEYTIFFQWAYARVVLSNAFVVAKQLFWFKIRVLID